MKKFTVGFLSFIYVLYIFGFIGLAIQHRERKYNMSELFIILACVNVIVWIVTIKIII